MLLIRIIISRWCIEQINNDHCGDLFFLFLWNTFSFPLLKYFSRSNCFRCKANRKFNRKKIDIIFSNIKDISQYKSYYIVQIKNGAYKTFSDYSLRNCDAFFEIMMQSHKNELVLTSSVKAYTLPSRYNTR